MLDLSIQSGRDTTTGSTGDALTDSVVRPKKRKYRQLDRRIHDLKERLRRGHIQLIDYADAVSHLLHLQ